MKPMLRIGRDFFGPLAVGLIAALAAVWLAGPTFWDALRVLEEARRLQSVKSDLPAVELLRIGARSQSDRKDRDELYEFAYQAALSAKRDDLAFDISLEAAAGPRRKAQVRAWTRMAEYQKKLGRSEEAVRLYNDIRSDYWDYYQGEFARRELLRVRLDELAALPLLTPEQTQEADGLLTQVGPEKYFNVGLRDLQVKVVLMKLDEASLQDLQLLKNLAVSMKFNRGTVLMQRLGALSATHPRGVEIAAVLRRLGIPVADSPSDLIRYASATSEVPPSKDEIAACLFKKHGLAELIAAFQSAGAESIAIRNKVASLLMQDGRFKDALGLLLDALPVVDPEPGFADAGEMAAECLSRMGRIPESALLWEHVVDTWPQHGGVCVRAGRQAADAYRKTGDKDAARRVLAKAAACATGEDRLELNRAALDLK